MLRHSVVLRGTALGCVVLVGSLLWPRMAAADPPPRPATIRETARVVAERRATELKVREARSQATQADLESPSFLKTPVGIAVLAAFGAGVGYALYSASNDRIRSAGR
jgi:hypothetical protein